jgi:hypothetical protein
MAVIIARGDAVEANLVTLHKLDAVTRIRNYDAEYAKLTGKLHECNQALYTLFASYLDRPSAPYTASIDPPAHMAMTVPELPEPSAHMAMAVLDPTNEIPCPYQHISTIPAPPPTTPHMEAINLNEPTARALFTRKMGTGTGIMALADSGASHILLQASAAHVLQQVEYSRENYPPFAELKAANHGVLTAIGRGILSISGLAVMAFIFADCDLANNLLGLVPFANLGCTGVFQPRTFMIYKEGDPTPILAGTRTSLDSLWQVPLHQDLGCVTDGIPPPSGTPGIYVEANAVSIQDNATYVRFVHACMGYPRTIYLFAGCNVGIHHGPKPISTLDAQDGT